jgi:hypothetical protein
VECFTHLSWHGMKRNIIRFLVGTLFAISWIWNDIAIRGVREVKSITIATSNVEKVTFILESYQGKRYYIYNNTNMTLHHIRDKAKDSSSVPTWGQQKWTKRFSSYALGELNYIETLEQYTRHLRTFDIQDADFVVVPIPLSAAVFWGTGEDITSAFSHLLYNEEYFVQNSEKHLYFAIIEKLLRGDYTPIKHFSGLGLTLELLVALSKGIVVKDFDTHTFHQFVLNNSPNDWKQALTGPLFQHQWSLGFAQECNNPNYPFVDVSDFEDWKSKQLTIFYRTPHGTSLFNSTIYRHALAIDQDGIDLYFPNVSSVGFIIPYDQWLQNFQSSQFCVVVRGDNPTSRSLFAAIRMGCMPIIVSDSLPYYQPMFRSLLKYEDFSIMVDEKEYLLQPSKSLKNAINSLTLEELQSKVNGLALLQRILVLDHPKSLFIPAFVHETTTRQKDKFPYLFEDDHPSRLQGYQSFERNFYVTHDPILWTFA